MNWQKKEKETEQTVGESAQVPDETQVKLMREIKEEGNTRTGVKTQLDTQGVRRSKKQNREHKRESMRQE